MSVVVLKFGGSSLASLARISHVADIIISHRKQGESVVVVVSAMAGVTDQLIGLSDQIGSRFCGREKAALLATGEMQSCCLLAMTLLARNVKAKSFNAFQLSLLAEGGFAESLPSQMDVTRIKNCLEGNTVAIVAGFQGLNESGDIVNFGRSGSDTTAVFLAGSLHAKRCDIYTDVDGVMTADPRYVAQAKCLSEVPVDIMQSYANFGAYVLHPNSVQVAKKMGIDVRVLSSFGRGSGTNIISNADLSQARVYGFSRQTGFKISQVLSRYADIECSDQLHHCTDGKYSFFAGEEGAIKWLIHHLRQKHGDEIAVATTENIDRIVMVGVKLQEFESVLQYMRKYAIYPELVVHDEYAISLYIPSAQTKQVMEDLHFMVFSHFKMSHLSD